MFSFVLLLTMISTSVFGAHHFSELSYDGSVWRVDHFKVEDRKLQDFVETRTFSEKSKAEKFIAKIQILNPKRKSLSQIKFVTKEAQTSPLWIVENQWSEEWEVKYSEWVTANFDKYFFEKYKITTDCADVAYSLRWIFSRINHLPAAATLAGSGAIVTQESAKAEWNSLETNEEWHKDKRFLAALDWLLNGVYTRTLYKDAYPVEINKDTIRAGLINLIGSHTEVFSSVSYRSDEIPMMVLSSTTPRAIRVLASRPYLDTFAIDKKDGGLLRFRWPELQGQTWTMVPKEKMNHYSMEQYDENLCPNEPRIGFCIIKKLGMVFKSDIVIRKIVQGLEDTIALRKNIIRDGLDFCSVNDCSPGTQGWEDWGTPSRDKRLGQSLKSAHDLANDIDQSSFFKKWHEKTLVDAEIPITIEKLQNRLVAGLTSYDPRDPVEARWALNPASILTTLNHRLLEYHKEREIQIEKAVVCRNDPALCQNSIEMFDQYSTIIIDNKMLLALKQWDKLCRVEPCPESFAGSSLIKKMWLQSPVPWHSVELRKGIASPANAHFLLADAVQVGGENFIILDGHRLYDLSSRKEKALPGNFSSLGYDNETGLLYGANRKEIVFFDQQLIVKGKLTFKNDFYKLAPINMGGGELFVTPDMPLSGTVGAVPVWIVDIKKMSSREFGQFPCISKVVDGNTTFFVMKGEKSLVMSSSDQGVVQIELPSLPRYFSDAIHLKDFDFLIRRYDQDIGMHVVHHVTPVSITNFMETEKLNSAIINSHFFFFMDYTVDGLGIKIFDRDLNRQLENASVRPSLPINDEAHLYISANNSGRLSMYRIDSEIKQLGATLGQGEYLMAAEENHFTYASMSGLITRDYDGNFLKQHPYILHGNCRGFISSNCRDPENKMWIEQFFIAEGEEDLGYMQVGMKNSADPFVFLVGDGSVSLGWGVFGSDRLVSNIGRQVDLGDGYLMWFQE